MAVIHLKVDPADGVSDFPVVFLFYIFSQQQCLQNNEGKYQTHESEQLEKIVNTSKSKEKLEIDFISDDGKIADTIAIKHNNIKLKIDLEKFKNE